MISMQLSSFAISWRKPALLALLILTTAIAQAKAWALTYAVTEESRSESADGTTPPKLETRSFTQTLTLTADTLAVHDDRRLIIHNFASRRVFNISTENASYRDWSLYSLVDGREAELFNRNALGAAMRAARIDQLENQFRRFDSESELQVNSRIHPGNTAAPVIEQVKLDNGLEFRHDGRTAVRVIASEVTLPAGLHHRFVNYLAYSCAIHPEIRRVIAATGTVPRELTFTARTLNRQTTTTLHLVSSARSDSDNASPPASATLADDGDDPVLQLLTMVRDAAQTGERPTRQDAISFARTRIADGHHLDALMALIEYGLQSGDNLTAEIREHRPAFARDARCQSYLKAFDQSTKAASEQSLALSDSIDRTGLRKAYMLDLQRANHLDRLGRSDEAMREYFKVIRANPFHAGALHDLGGLLTRRYDHPKAWACWDAARRLYPAHPMFKDVIEREHRLVADHPDFF